MPSPVCGLGDAVRHRSYKREDLESAASVGRQKEAGANLSQNLARMRALAGIFFAAGMRSTLLANTLAPRFRAKGNALGSGRRRSAFTVGFGKNFSAHGNISNLVSLLLFSHSLGLCLAAGNRQGVLGQIPCDT